MVRTPLVYLMLLLGANAVSAQFTAATDSSHWTARAERTQHAASSYGYSDCTTENSLGLVNGGEIAWFQGVDTRDRGLANDAILRVSSSWGWAGCSDSACSVPGPGGMFVYDDPGGDDTDPTDLGGADLRASERWYPIGFPDVKETRVMKPPAHVSGGFWIAAMASQAAGEFPAPIDTDTAPSNGHTWVTGSNTKYDPQDPGGGIGFFEMAALGFDSHWVMSADGASSEIVSYCTAKDGLICGTPALGSSGLPQAGVSSGFILDAAPARGQRGGLFLYGCSGRAALPFDGGWLCVAPPVRRSVAVGSNGTAGQCDGVFTIDWNAFAAGALGGAPDSCLSNSGQQVNVQCWGRDSTATGSFLSDALEFVVL